MQSLFGPTLQRWEKDTGLLEVDDSWKSPAVLAITSHNRVLGHCCMAFGMPKS